MVAVGYCCDGMESFPVEEQKRRVEEYAAAHSMEISQWYIDHFGDERRREMEKIILVKEKYVSKYKRISAIDTVIVADGRVLGDDIRYPYYLRLILGGKSISLLSANEEVFDDGTGVGALYSSITEYILESERVRKAPKPLNPYWYAFRLGFAPPYGYKIENGKCVIVPDEVKNVRYIFQMREAGRTEEEICRTLQGEGILGRTGKKFALVSVRAILKKESFYRGTEEFFGRDHVKIEYETVLPKLPEAQLTALNSVEGEES